MGRAKIKRIVAVRGKVTEVELEHGGLATGYNEQWSVGEEVIEIYHARYHRIKILKAKLDNI